MKSNFAFFIIVVIVSICISCDSSTKNAAVLHRIETTTFSDDLILEGTVEAVHSKTIFCPNNIEATILYLVKDGDYVKPGDTLCIMENRELNNQFEQVSQRLEQTKAEFGKSKANLDLQYALLEAQVKSNEAHSSITDLDSIQLQYASPVQQRIKSLEMQKRAIEKAKIEKKLGYLKKINESELRKLKLQIARDSNRVENIKSILSSLIVIAQDSGMALRAQSPMRTDKILEGDLVWEGLPIVYLPDLSEVKVIINASESDYKRIEVSNKIKYSFNSMPGNYAYGKVLLKAPVGIPISRNSKVKYFEITTTVDSFKIIPEPGISATCIVSLREVKDTIVIPQLAIFDIDSSKYVFVMKDAKFEKREVVIGDNSPKYAVIIAGLNNNEVVSLVQQPDKAIVSTVLIPDSIKQKLILHKQTINGNSPNISESAAGIMSDKTMKNRNR